MISFGKKKYFNGNLFFDKLVKGRINGKLF
jgi:hypothetical protein